MKPSTIQRATISIRPSAARLAGSNRSARRARVLSMGARKVIAAFAREALPSSLEGRLFNKGSCAPGPCMLICIHHTPSEPRFMSSRRRVVVSTAGLLLCVGACSSAPGGAVQLASTPEKVASRVTLTPAELDSVFAQRLAEREGPRVSVSAEFMTFAYGSRRLRANIHLDDDAYVL